MVWKYLVAIMLFGYALVILCLNIVGTRDFTGMRSIDHGWPAVYMRRSLVYVPSSPPFFTDDVDAVLADRLPIDSAAILEFSTWRLLANIAVGIGGGIILALAGRFFASRLPPPRGAADSSSGFE